MMPVSARARALVTGGSGFIGSHLVARLMAQGWDVSVLARETTDPGLIPAGALICRDDGTAAGLLAQLRQVRPEVIFHLASRFLSSHGSDDIPSLVGDNILFPTRLLEAATQVPCRHFINTGTAWQHYAGPGYEAANLYAATKQAFADLLDYFVKARGIKAITLELVDSYGPADRRRKLVNLLGEAAKSGTVLEMSSGEQLIDLVHVGDVVAAYEVAASRVQGDSFSGSEIWSVTSGELHSLREVVALFQELHHGLPVVAWGRRPYREREVMRPWVGRPLPGWLPRISLEEGLASLWKDGSDRFPLGHEEL